MYADADSIPKRTPSGRGTTRKPSVDQAPQAPPDTPLNLLPRTVSSTNTNEDSAGDEDKPESDEEQAAPTKSMTEQEAKAKIDEDVKKFFNIRDVKEGEKSFADMPDEHKSKLVDKLVSKALESKEADVKLVAELFDKIASKGCPPSAFGDGFAGVFEFLDSKAIDVPEAYNFMAMMLRGAKLPQETIGSLADKIDVDGDSLIKAKDKLLMAYAALAYVPQGSSFMVRMPQGAKLPQETIKPDAPQPSQQQPKRQQALSGLEPVAPLQQSENRWTPAARSKVAVDENSPEFVERKVKALLNKLTLVNFDSVSTQIINWANKSENETNGATLSLVIKLVCERATNEAHWSDMYARLCRKMMEQISQNVQDDNVRNDPGGEPIVGGNLFRKYMLYRCQEDFERIMSQKESAQAAATLGAADDKATGDAFKANDNGTPASYSDEYYALLKAKRRCIGLLRFIGELYKLQMLTERIMHECIKKLLSKMDHPEEEEIESLCKLLMTVGQVLDRPKAKGHMDIYFGRMQMLADNPNVASRIRYMLLDVIELRHRSWRPRNATTGPSTIAQVREQDANEKAAAAQQASRVVPMGRGGSRRGNRGAPEQGPDGWNVAGPTPVRAPAKAGNLSNFGKLTTNSGPLKTMVPWSVFEQGDRGRDTPPPQASGSISRAPARSNLLSLFRAGGADADTMPKRTPNGFGTTRKPSVDQAPQASPYTPLPRTRRAQRLPRTRAIPSANTSEDKPENDERQAHPTKSFTKQEAKAKVDEDVKELSNIRDVREGENSFAEMHDEHKSKLVDKLASKALDYRWTPVVRSKLAVDENSPEFAERKVKALLNKLALENFDSISTQIVNWANKSENERNGATLSLVIKLVCERATDEAHWSDMYARLCRKMMEQISQNVQDDNIRHNSGEPIVGGHLFRKYLLNRCQEDFERGWSQKESAQAAAALKAADDKTAEDAFKANGENGGHVLYSDEYYALLKAKRQGLGLVRFIGELFKLQMLTEGIMHECIKKLLSKIDNPEEEEIESLCRLLTTVGQALDTPKAKGHMDIYFGGMQMLADNPHVASRIRYMLLDVIELRHRIWRPRNATEGPSTIAQVQLATQKPTTAHLQPETLALMPAQASPTNTSSAAHRDDDIGQFITHVDQHPICINGHFGDVFKGIHRTVGEVALKRLRIGGTGGEEEVFRRFEKEANTWRHLKHRHILKFLGTLRLGTHLCFVSPFIKNGTLLQYVKHRVDVNRVRLLCETAAAIDYLHQKGMVHGDIKAGNILISDDDHVLLCDFGLSKFADTDTSTAIKGAATTRWQSPELWDDAPKTFKSDVYAFSMTIVEVLKVQNPYRLRSQSL